MTSLKFGVVMPLAGPDLSAVEEAESLGYDSVWSSEHIFFYGPTMDAFTVLAAYAARTQRVLLGTAVTLLPLRPPAVVAKEATSVDIISGGRLILGVGVGGEYPKEFEACGVPVQERGARANEAIRILRRLWREDNVTYRGRFWQLGGVTLQPKPVQPGGPPIWVAGRSEAAMRRAGRLGDGYLPYLFSPERFRDGWQKVRQYAQEAGRDPDSLTPALYQFVSLADSYEEAKASAVGYLSRTYNQPFENIVDRYVVLGTPRDCVHRLEQYVEAGVRHFLLVFIGPGAARDQLRAFASQVAPALR
ncbi:MAG: LLM class flavin-dependent oxidoreductase [Dehalococcoidia bacterium]|nr:LLM class flavin-dependent oxidoreductase [Dehalococcoidia bacterium]MDW8008954.1 LLM class flavin-dependent oxidoreductase [Chloroflexota bacterium]